MIDEAGISHKGLASRMRIEAEKLGLAISPDHVSIRRWLDGVRPHDDTIRCIAAALGVKLERKITFAEIGFDSAPVAEAEIDDGVHYSPKPDEAVDLLSYLTAADLSDSPSLAGSRWVSETAPSVITGYLFAEPPRVEQVDSLATAGAHIAERIRATIRYLMSLDFQFGGGHTRKMLLFYWKTEIVPALQQRYPELIRREIFSAVADAVQMLGWSAYDAGRHGAAQRYFVQGLRLAREANDHLIGGRILSNLSHQANYLGNFSDAIQFARAAQAATVGKATATVNAMFLSMEARALASIGDGRACSEILHRAEREFGQRIPGEDPDWISYFDAFELAGEAAHCFRDLRKPKETEVFVAQAIDPIHTPPRTRAFIGMVSAGGALSAGELDHAVSIATDAVELAGPLQSNRYIRYLEDFHKALTENAASHPSVRAFTDLIRSSYPTLTLAIPDIVRTGASQGTARHEASASAPGTHRQSQPTRQRSA